MFLKIEIDITKDRSSVYDYPLNKYGEVVFSPINNTVHKILMTSMITTGILIFASFYCAIFSGNVLFEWMALISTALFVLSVGCSLIYYSDHVEFAVAKKGK